MCFYRRLFKSLPWPLGNQQKGHPKMSASRIMATFDEKTTVPFEDTMEASEESDTKEP